MRVLFLFMDGIGLGVDDPHINPFVRASMPNLRQLLNALPLVHNTAPVVNGRASLIALDAGLGVPGLAQSATGQAVLLTGRNVPAEIGVHYGPKPNPAVAAVIRSGNLFKTLRENGYTAALLNAYPPRYFEGVDSGRRIYSAIPLSAVSAGLPLMTQEDLFSGRALSADFTGAGWRQHLGIAEAPVLTPTEAGRRLASLASQFDLSFFEYWLSDYAGHGQNMEQACSLLEEFDQVLAGLLEAWDDDSGLILITSDHGNLEDLGTRRHTLNPVPGLLIGAPDLRQAFSAGLTDLTGIAPAILRLIRQA